MSVGSFSPGELKMKLWTLVSGRGGKGGKRDLWCISESQSCPGPTDGGEMGATEKAGKREMAGSVSRGSGGSFVCAPVREC